MAGVDTKLLAIVHGNRESMFMFIIFYVMGFKPGSEYSDGFRIPVQKRLKALREGRGNDDSVARINFLAV